MLLGVRPRRGAAAVAGATRLSRWFTWRRGTAVGVVTPGAGLGGLVVLPSTAELLTAVGRRVAFAVATLLVVPLNGAFLLLVGDDPPAP